MAPRILRRDSELRFETHPRGIPFVGEATLISKTKMRENVQAFRWRAVGEDLAQNPKLTAFPRRARTQLAPHLLRDECAPEKAQPRACHPRRPSWRRASESRSLSRGPVEGDAPLVCGSAGRESGARALSAEARLGPEPLSLGVRIWRRSDLGGSWGRDRPAGRSRGDLPFLAAVGWSRFRAAETLLKLGANVDFQDTLGMTALHYMLKKRSDKKHLRVLEAYRPRVDLKYRDGITAAEVMRHKRDPELREMATRLSEKGS